MRTNTRRGTSLLSCLLEQILRERPQTPRMGPFPQRREYLDSLVTYTTVLRIQEQRRREPVDDAKDWPFGVAHDLQKQAGTLGAAGPEPQILGIEFPPPLPREEWEKKYAPIFAKYCGPSVAQPQQEVQK